MILDKPGHLDDDEFRIVKRHSALTREILSRMPSLEEISLIAGEHHEKLDGTGYPFGLKAENLSLESRLIAVADVYGALSEDRPYRAGLDPDEIARIMKRDVPNRLDGECFEALQAVWPQRLKLPDTPEPETLPAVCMVPQNSAAQAASRPVG
jgi:HD-GYP domain-containing protein (c-di-GMP phosphodiesterase class II)